MIAPALQQFFPVVRSGDIVTDIFPNSLWTDNLVLAPSVGVQYAVPAGVNAQGVTVMATIFRVTTDSNLVWISANAPVSSSGAVLTGAGSVPIRVSYFFQVPSGNVDYLYLVSPLGARVSIEGWF